MSNRFLLYIDILGFSDLVANSIAKIDDLYEVIASLQAHDHDAFKCVIFSDTILVYNLDGGDFKKDKQYLVMFMCEFARDLMHRLTNRGIFFRAVITYGNFRHYELNSIPCFFGTALIHAHNAEKEIKAIGLFLDSSLRNFCHIFRHHQFNNTKFDFVYITQALDQLEEISGGSFPINHPSYLEQTDLILMATPELPHLVDLYNNLSSNQLPNDVKAKYAATIKLYESQYPAITAFLKQNAYNITLLSPSADWQKEISRHPVSMSWRVKSKTEH